MRRDLSRAAALAILLAAAAAEAGGSRSYLVPSYTPCPEGMSSCPAVRASRFTFESALLRSSAARYLRDGKTAFAVQLRGVRDETGALVTTDPADPDDDFRVVVPASQITFNGTTVAPGILSPDIVLRFDLEKGKGKVAYQTPPGGEGTGLVAESLAAPFVVDGDGNRLAVTGSQDKPAK